MGISVKPKLVLFYSSVNDFNDFYIQKFYTEDIAILKELGYEVRCTNKISEFLYRNYDIAFFYFYKKSLFPAIISYFRNKNIYYTGGIDEISPFYDGSKIKKIISSIFFILNFLISTKINIVSKSDYLNVKKLLRKVKIKNLSKLFIFPHSVDVRLDHGLIKNSNTFVTICWMSTVGNVKRKGVDRAIEIFSSYVEHNKNAKFYIIGKVGRGTDYLKSLCYYQKISSNIIFTDFIDDETKYKILNEATYYFQLSKYEGFGIGILEANLANCYVLHAGNKAGGYLDTEDFWGMNIVGENILALDKSSELIRKINYNEELNIFAKRYQTLIKKYSREERKKCISQMFS